MYIITTNSSRILFVKKVYKTGRTINKIYWETVILFVILHALLSIHTPSRYQTKQLSSSDVYVTAKDRN